MKFEDKVALVTGAGSGIGRAIALALAREGTDVGVNDIDPVSAQNTTQEIKGLGRKAIAVKADVSNAEEVDAMVDTVLGELGRIDILVNNAGNSPQFVRVTESSVQAWDSVVAVHLRGTFLCSRRVGQWMEKQKTGNIINIVSIAACGGSVGGVDYGAAKAGIVNLTQVMALEEGRYGINVNCIAPGWIDTPLTQRNIKRGKLDMERIIPRIPLGRLGSPDDIAKAAVFLASKDADYITGVVLQVDGGWLASGGPSLS